MEGQDKPDGNKPKGAPRTKSQSPDPLRIVLRENAKLREQRRVLKTRVAELESATPALNAEAATQYQAFLALGLSPEELKAKLDAAAELQGQLDKQTRETTVRNAADLVGYKASVLADLATARGLAIEIRENAAVVVECDKATPLAEYAEANLTDHLPALQATAAPAASKPKPWAPQKPAAGKAATSGNPADAILARYKPSSK